MKDNLLQQAKVEAARKKISLTAFIEDAVEQKLRRSSGRVMEVSDFEIITCGSGGTRPGVRLDDNSSLLDLMDN